MVLVKVRCVAQLGRTYRATHPLADDALFLASHWRVVCCPESETNTRSRAHQMTVKDEDKKYNSIPRARRNGEQRVKLKS